MDNSNYHQTDEAYVRELAKCLSQSEETAALAKRLLRCELPLLTKTRYCSHGTPVTLRQLCGARFCPICNPRIRNHYLREYKPLALHAAEVIEAQHPDLGHEFWWLTLKPPTPARGCPVDPASHWKTVKRALEIFIQSTYLPKVHKKRAADEIPTTFVIFGWHLRWGGCHPHLLVYGPAISEAALRQAWQDAYHRAYREESGYSGPFRFPRRVRRVRMSSEGSREEAVGKRLLYLTERFRKWKSRMTPAQAAAVITAQSGRMISYRGLAPFKKTMPPPRKIEGVVCRCCGERVTESGSTSRCEPDLFETMLSSA